MLTTSVTDDSIKAAEVLLLLPNVLHDIEEYVSVIHQFCVIICMCSRPWIITLMMSLALDLDHISLIKNIIEDKRLVVMIFENILIILELANTLSIFWLF